MEKQRIYKEKKNIGLNIVIGDDDITDFPVAYGSEYCTLRKLDKIMILTAEMSWLRKIAVITRLQKIGNDDIRQALVSRTTLLDKAVQLRLRWFGHVEKMTVDRIPHSALHVHAIF